MPTFSLTSHGVQAKLPLIRIKDGGLNSPAIAVLACTERTGYVGMFLHHCSKQTALPLYGVGVPPSFYEQLGIDAGMVTCNRLVYASPPDGYLDEELTWPFEIGFADANELVVEWAEIYISHVYGGYPAEIPAEDADAAGDFPVIPRWNVAALARMGFTLADTPRTGAVDQIDVTKHMRDGDEQVALLKWHGPTGKTAFIMRLAADRKHRWGETVYSNVRACVTVGEGNRGAEMSRVDKWERGAAMFGDDKMQVRLFFSFAQRRGASVLEVSVGGSAFGLPPLT